MGLHDSIFFIRQAPCFIQDTIKPDDEMRENIEFEKEDLSQVIDLLEEVQWNMKN